MLFLTKYLYLTSAVTRLTPNTFQQDTAVLSPSIINEFQQSTLHQQI